MLERFLIFLIIFSISFKGISQNGRYSLNREMIISPLTEGSLDYVIALNQFNQTYGELGVCLGYRESKKGMAYGSYQLTTEFGGSFKNFIIAPKLTYSYSLVILNFSSSLIYYSDFKDGAYYFRPSFGFSYFGYYDIIYGYNFAFNNSIPNVNSHNIGIRFIIKECINDRIFKKK